MINVLARWSWKGCFSVTLGKTPHCSSLLGDRAHQVYMIGILRRQSFKVLITDIGKPLHIHSGLPGGRAYQVNLIGFLGRWCCKGHLSQ